MKLNIQKSIERENEKQERIFPVLLSNLDKATNFLDTIEKEINLHDETQKNKVRRQFEDWNTTVHGSIQKKISHTINSMDAKALNKKKNEDYEKFLSITNRKPAIFRDIIIESEYDPLEPNRHCIKAKTGFLKDPVKIDAQKAASEGAMLGDKSVRSARLCKETLSVELWATGKIEATPYGTFERMMNKKGGSGSGEAVVSKRNSTQRSSVIMDHFDYPRSKESIDREMPRGKRIQPILIYADPGKVFHQGVPKDFGEDLARIKPAENYSYLA
ncbi:hypothetical protein B484DRAFT_338977 [Ochromonadaceae sp. CCMP2298]|nr:hypothetical protein B484DRAFT_338977 [Ochromonadaceae sp. CCMP2298]